MVSKSKFVTSLRNHGHTYQEINEILHGYTGNAAWYTEKRAVKAPVKDGNVLYRLMDQGYTWRYSMELLKTK